MKHEKRNDGERSGTELKDRDLRLAEIAFQQIELQAKHLDKLIANTSTLYKCASFLVASFAVIVCYFSYGSISELRKDINRSVTTEVDTYLQNNAELETTIADITSNLRDIKIAYDDIISNHKELTAQQRTDADAQYDPYAAYKEIQHTTTKDVECLSKDERGSVRCRLQGLIKAALAGGVDSEILAGAADEASKLNLNYEAVQLSTLAYAFNPKKKNQARKYANEDIFGLRFQLVDHKLTQDSTKAEAIRTEAQEGILKLLEEKPIQDNEIIYQQANIIAVRNKDNGQMEKTIAILEKNVAEPQAPSYAFAILSRFYAIQGHDDWKAKYEKFAAAAKMRRKAESPLCSWYQNTETVLKGDADRLAKIKSSPSS